MTSEQKKFFQKVGAFYDGTDKEITEQENTVINQIMDLSLEAANELFDKEKAYDVALIYTNGYITGAESVVNALETNYGDSHS